MAASTATIPPTQDWKPALPYLDSNTTYYYVVRAHDSNGNEQVKTGSFKTLTRRVEVNFAEIEMIDDSDDPRLRVLVLVQRRRRDTEALR